MSKSSLFERTGRVKTHMLTPLKIIPLETGLRAVNPTPKELLEEG